MADIFISYSSEDLDRVKPLAEALEERGWSVWWDRRIIVGQSFEEIIEEAIDDANCVIAVWSSRSINSKWVRAEAAEGFRKRILAPILIEEVKLPLLYRQLQTASLIGWDGSTSHSGFKQLIRDLIEMLGMPPKPAETIDQGNEIEDIEQNGDDAETWSETWNNRGDTLNKMEIIDQDEAVDDVEQARAWFTKGNTLDRSKRYQEAISAFDKALEIYPDYAQAWCNKGLSLKRLGQYEEAISAYDKALKIDPGYTRALNNKGDALKQMNIIDQDETVGHVEQARAWFVKGNSLDRLKQYQEAIFAFDKALEIDPDYTQAWCNKGLSLKRLGRYEEAIYAYDKALEIDPCYIRAWNNKGDAHKQFGRNREAKAAYKKAKELEKK